MGLSRFEENKVRFINQADLKKELRYQGLGTLQIEDAEDVKDAKF